MDGNDVDARQRFAGFGVDDRTGKHGAALGLLRLCGRGTGDTEDEKKKDEGGETKPHKPDQREEQKRKEKPGHIRCKAFSSPETSRGSLGALRRRERENVTTGDGGRGRIAEWAAETRSTGAIAASDALRLRFTSVVASVGGRTCLLDTHRRQRVAAGKRPAPLIPTVILFSTTPQASMHRFSADSPASTLSAGIRYLGRTALVAAVLACTLVLAGCDDDDDGGMGTTPDPTITELAAGEGSLSTLVDALQQAGLDDDLSAEGPFTVFAPANSAFENIDAGELTGDDELLQEVLTYHVVAGQEIAAGDISDGQTVETLEGDTLRFSVDNGTVRVNGAVVQTPNLQASNGIVHVVDRVLLETVDAVDRAILTPDLATAAQAISAAGLGDALRADGPFTIFAPVNSAFDGLETSALVSDQQLLTSVLQYHVVSGQRVTSDQITNDTDPQTLEGSTLDLQVSNGTVTVNGIPVSTADIQTENAVIHLIDGVLLQRINAVQRATISSDFTVLADLVGRANLADALSGPGPDGMDGITVFAPTNEALLAALDSNDDGEISDSEAPSNLSDILQYHVVDDVYFAADVPTSETPLETLEGSDVTVVRSGSDVTINPNASDDSVSVSDEVREEAQRQQIADANEGVSEDDVLGLGGDERRRGQRGRPNGH